MARSVPNQALLIGQHHVHMGINLVWLQMDGIQRRLTVRWDDPYIGAIQWIDVKPEMASIVDSVRLIIKTAHRLADADNRTFGGNMRPLVHHNARHLCTAAKHQQTGRNQRGGRSKSLGICANIKRDFHTTAECIRTRGI